MDHKWSLIWEYLIPQVRKQLVQQLSLPDPDRLVFAPNTHELVVRLFSCLTPPIRVLTTDAEFYSFDRQLRRWEEAGLAKTVRVSVEPFDSFSERFIAAGQSEDFQLAFVSQVFFNSGFLLTDLDRIVDGVYREGRMVVIDGYHGFMAVPTDLSSIANRSFYMAGGYKYAMSGEGACFVQIPEEENWRPVNTGWFAQPVLQPPASPVDYGIKADRFWGSTFDPSGLYRMRSVLSLLERKGLPVERIRDWVEELQTTFLDQVAERVPGLGKLVPPHPQSRGNFLSFYHPNAEQLKNLLESKNVVVDQRASRLRFGFGIYQTPEDLESLLERVAEAIVELP